MSRQPGRASGWCCYIIEKDNHWIISDGEESSTNNRMELTAVNEALDFAQDPTGAYTIYTDSKLTLNCATGVWRRKANLDLWEIFDRVSQDKVLEWIWVKAHNGNPYNEIVDKIAKSEAIKIQKIKNKKNNIVV